MKRHKAARRTERFALNPLVTFSGVPGAVLELLADVNHMRNHIPEPFDIFAHAGNLWGGAFLAGVAIQAKAKGGSNYLSRQQLHKFRKYWVPGVVAATLAVNAVTETKWGVKTLPVAKWLNGTTPDPLDAIYSAGMGALVATFGWRKVKSPPRRVPEASKQIPTKPPGRRQ